MGSKKKSLNISQAHELLAGMTRCFATSRAVVMALSGGDHTVGSPGRWTLGYRKGVDGDGGCHGCHQPRLFWNIYEDHIYIIWLVVWNMTFHDFFGTFMKIIHL